MQDREIGLVDAVHVAGDRGGENVRGVVLADIEHVMAFVFMGTDQLAVQRNMVGEQRVCHDALAGAEVFAGMAGLEGEVWKE